MEESNVLWASSSSSSRLFVVSVLKGTQLAYQKPSSRSSPEPQALGVASGSWLPGNPGRIGASPGCPGVLVPRCCPDAAPMLRLHVNLTSLQASKPPSVQRQGRRVSRRPKESTHRHEQSAL
ncbi:hypothetical protein ACJ73_01693 [Blastomyces percursus]|uniref:Uncharacterized protein n=1 Tax=Blastomyces percursus TaxID=1658174 RepID=A0A1J9RFZ9_9EURO|nr:hypothetical protein ACJ73_01693 [Blastomyces percursus]